MATLNFDHINPKIIEITFSFPEFAPACKKVVQPINSFLRYSQFWNPVTWLATPISDKAHPKILIYMNLCQNGQHLAILLICSGDMVD